MRSLVLALLVSVTSLGQDAGFSSRAVNNCFSFKIDVGDSVGLRVAFYSLWSSDEESFDKFVQQERKLKEGCLNYREVIVDYGVFTRYYTFDQMRKVLYCRHRPRYDRYDSNGFIKM
jgi:hypothetical protein